MSETKRGRGRPTIDDGLTTEERRAGPIVPSYRATIEERESGTASVVAAAIEHLAERHGGKKAGIIAAILGQARREGFRAPKVRS